MREFRAAQARRIAKRWEKAHAAESAGPVRKTRVTEITIRDTIATMRVIRIERNPTTIGWGRASVSENGIRLSRKMGVLGLARLIAQTL